MIFQKSLLIQRIRNSGRLLRRSLQWWFIILFNILEINYIQLTPSLPNSMYTSQLFPYTDLVRNGYLNLKYFFDQCQMYPILICTHPISSTTAPRSVNWGRQSHVRLHFPWIQCELVYSHVVLTRKLVKLQTPPILFYHTSHFFWFLLIYILWLAWREKSLL